MRAYFLTLFIMAASLSATANWTPLTTGINDHFNDVYFWNDNEGIVTGNKGIYYTLTGGSTAADWTRFSIPGNSADNDLYNRCKFLKMATLYSTKEVYISGYDTVNNRAIIFYFKPGNQSYKFCYTGPANSALYNIRYSNSNNAVFAVGNAGLLVRYIPSSGLAKVYPALTTKTLRCLAFDDASSYNLNMAGDGIYLKVALFNDTLTLGNSTDLVYTITSMETESSQLYATGPSGFYKGSANSPGSFTEVTTYKNGPLHATQIVKSFTGFRYFVATDHGVFAKFQDMLEIQPASTGYALNALSFMAANGLAVGCGNNGLLIKSTNSGGGTIPYLSISVTNGCKGDYIHIIKPQGGSATNCNIKLFNSSNTQVYNYNSCALSLQIGWNTAGDFTLQYVMTNDAGFSDTTLVPLHIPDPPAINLPVTISDNILCKKEQVMLTVANASAGWDYILRRQGDATGHYGGTAGNGANIQFQSTFIENTGNYYIQVQNQQNGCQRGFTDLIPVTVEQTKSRMASEFINSFQGENIQLSAISNDAQNYKWTFDNSASQTSAGGKNVQVAFNSLGEKFVTLESWSNNGCYDTALLKVTRVMSEASALEECFNLNIPGEDVQHNATDGVPLLKDMELISDGLLLGAGAYKYSLRSVSGESLDTTDYGGSILAKYTKKGTLRWRVYTKYPNYTCPTCYYSQKPAVHHVETLSDGNILFAGNERSDTWMYFNNGDSVRVAQGGNDDQFNGYLAKINSHGNLLWRGRFLNGQVKLMKQDRFGNIWIVLWRGFNVYYTRDGSASVLLATTGSHVDNAALLVKLNSNGNLLYTAPMNLVYRDASPDFNDLVIDNDGNAWIAGKYHARAEFHNNNGTLAATINRLDGSIYYSSFVVKYSAACNYLFYINAGVLTTGGTSYHRIYANKLALDSLNNVYVLGMTDANTSQDNIHFAHSDGTRDTASVGGFFLSKFNTAGQHQWTNGSRYAGYYANGHSITTTAGSVFITSTINDNSDGIWSGQLTSTDGNHVNMTVNTSTFIIGEYNYAGKLLRAVHSNTSLGGYILPNTIIKQNNRLYIGGETDRSNGGTASYDLFNQTLPSVGSDGFFTILGDNYCYSGQAPVANAGRDTVICAGSYAGIGTIATDDTYAWTSSPAGFASAVANPMVNPAVTTTYYLAVFSPAGFVARDTVVITVNGSLAKAGADRTICMGDNTTLGISATGDTYAWTSNPAGFSAGIANPVVSPAITTTYYLEVINGACTSKDTVTVTVASPPIANAGIDQSVCAGFNAIIGTFAVGGHSYSWTSDPAGFTANSANPGVRPAVTTRYFLRVSNGSCATYDTVVITVLPLPVAHAGIDTTICTGSSVSIGSAAIAGNTYSWTSWPAGFTSNAATVVVNPAVPTYYYLAVNDGSCMAKDTIHVSLLIQPKAIAGADTAICQGNNVTFGTTALPGFKYAWTSSSGYTSPGAIIMVSPAVTTSYFLQVSVGNCSSNDTVVVQVNPLPVLTLTDTLKTICAGTGTNIGIPAQAGYSYNWTSVPAGFTSTLSDPSVAPTVTTTYHLVQTNIGTGCTASGRVTVTVDTCNARVIDYTLYPNPSPGYIIIKLDSITTDIITFELIDGYGKILLQQKLDQTTRIELARVPSGIYAYRIRRGNEVIKRSGRLIIQR